MSPEQLGPWHHFLFFFFHNSGASRLVNVDRGLGLATRSESKGTSSASDFQGELSPWGIALADGIAELEHQSVSLSRTRVCGGGGLPLRRLRAQGGVGGWNPFWESWLCETSKPGKQKTQND